MQGQGVVQARRHARRAFLQCLLQFGQGAIHIAQAQVGLRRQRALAQQVFAVSLAAEQVNQAHAVGQVVRLQLQDAPIGSDGVLDASVDDIGIDEDGVLGDGLLDLALTHVNLAQHLVDIQVLRGHIDHAQALLDGGCQQAMIDIILDVAHGLDDLQAHILRQADGTCHYRVGHLLQNLVL